jgi:hypothetical protein
MLNCSESIKSKKVGWASPAKNSLFAPLQLRRAILCCFDITLPHHKETTMLINPADLKNRLMTLSGSLMQLRGRL